jgi:hypothetical protein
LRKPTWRKANLKDANLEKANLWGADLRGANLRGAILEGADIWEADLRGANLHGVDLCNVESFYKAKLDPGVLSEIKTRWPEKFATLLDVSSMDWVIDTTILEQVKSPEWQGWQEKEDQDK